MLNDQDNQNLMMQWGLNVGQKMLQESEKGLTQYLPFFHSLRRYFRVDHRYVQRKLQMILCPFTDPEYGVKSFLRAASLTSGGSSSGGGGASSMGGYQFGEDNEIGFRANSNTGSMFDANPNQAGGGAAAGSSSARQTPVEDHRSFDLYIPLMAIITFATLAGYIKGIHNDQPLTADFFLQAFSSMLFWLVFEVIAIKIGRYVLGLPLEFAVLDLVALCGYKYVGVCCMIFLREILPFEQGLVVTLMVTYFAAAAALFAFHAMVGFYLRDGKPPKRCLPLAYGAAAIQVPFILWFSAQPF